MENINVFENVRELIGNTPLLKINNINIPETINFFAKLEFYNPGGSIKDRLGVALIRAAEESGELKPNGVIIEPTAGNTGIGLAIAAIGTSYKVIFIVPEKFSEEKQELMRALGAEIINTPTKDGIKGAINKAQELAKSIPNSYIPSQFTNPENPKSHYEMLAPELWSQLNGNIDIFIAGAGSAGTFMGIAKFLKEKKSNIKCIIVEPEGSIIAGGLSGPHKTEGIGMEFFPEYFNIDLIDDIYTVKDEDAFSLVNQLALKEGLLVGSSSGAVCYAAICEAKKAKPDTNIVTIFPDSSERYLSKMIYRGGI